MDEIIRLLESLSSNEEKERLLRRIYSYGFEDGKIKSDEEFDEAIHQILRIRDEVWHDNSRRRGY